MPGASTALESDDQQADQGETENDENNIDRTHVYVLRLLLNPRWKPCSADSTKPKPARAFVKSSQIRGSPHHTKEQ